MKGRWPPDPEQAQLGSKEPVVADDRGNVENACRSERAGNQPVADFGDVLAEKQSRREVVGSALGRVRETWRAPFAKGSNCLAGHAAMAGHPFMRIPLELTAEVSRHHQDDKLANLVGQGGLVAEYRPESLQCSAHLGTSQHRIERSREHAVSVREWEDLSALSAWPTEHFLIQPALLAGELLRTYPGRSGGQ